MAKAITSKWKKAERNLIEKVIGQFAKEEGITEQMLLEKLAKNATITMMAELLGFGAADGTTVNPIRVAILSSILEEHDIKFRY